MPRFENEGFQSDKRRDVDRTVPEDENYYGVNPVDLDFNNRENVVRDNQIRNNKRSAAQQGINPCDSGDGADGSGYSAGQTRFRSETAEDFRRSRQSAKRKTQDKPSGGRSPEKKNRGKKRRRRKPKAGVIIIAVILALVLILVGSVSVVMGRVNYNDKEENEYVSSSELESSGSVKNILLLGVDARSGENAEETRSDTMMLVSLDTKHRTIKLTSFLRDSWVYIPTLGYEQRLNAACSSGGYQGVVDAIEYNFGVDIDGYAVVDFEMFEVLVDSIGGVEVDVTEAEAEEVTNHPGRYGDVVLESGTQTLTGEQALAYCRIRKIDTDFVRTERQRTVMSAIISKVKSSNPFKLYSMAYKSAPYVETDLTKSEIRSLILRAALCLGSDIQQTSVPFDGTWEYTSVQGNSVIGLDVDANKTKLIDYIYNLSAQEIEAQQSEE